MADSEGGSTPRQNGSPTNKPTARTSPDDRIPGFVHRDEGSQSPRSGSDANDLCILLTVKSGTPWGFEMTRSNVGELFVRVSGQVPHSIEFLDDDQILVTLDDTVPVTAAAMRLAKLKTWLGRDVEFSCMIASEAELRVLHRDRDRSKRERREIDDRLKALLRERDEEIALLVQHFEDKVSELQKVAERIPEATSPSRLEVETASLPLNMGRDIIRFPLFSGGEPPQKGEVRFDHWKFEISEALRVHHPERVREGLVKSLRGNAADIVRHLGVGSTLEQILERLTLAFETISDKDVLLQEYYKLSQESGESVQQYSIRLEAALEKIRIRYPESHSLREADTSLKDRLFHGMRKEIRDSIRFRFEDKVVTYQDLLAAARKAESEGGAKKIIKVNSKATKVAHGFVNKESDVVGSQLSELLTTLKSLNVGGQNKKKGPSGKKPNSGEGNSGENSKPSYSNKPWRKRVRCYKCGGWGHISKECSSTLNSKKGGSDQETPQNQQDQSQHPEEKEGERAETLSQTSQ